MLSRAEEELLLKPNIGHLATLKQDGSPHSTPVWIDVVGGHILVNTTRERIKTKQVERDPRVSLSVHDRDTPLSMVTIQGRVADITEEGAVDHIHALAMKYTGKRFERLTPGHTRVILKIRIEQVASRIL